MSDQESAPSHQPLPPEEEDKFHLNGKTVAIGSLSAIAMLGVILEETMRHRHVAMRKAEGDE